MINIYSCENKKLIKEVLINFIDYLEYSIILVVKLVNMSKKETRKKYWKENIRYLSILLSIWFVVSYVCGILLVDQLNLIQIGGFKLGFWFAQQGAMYVFVVLIFVYVRWMNKLDKKYGVDE